MTTRTQAEIQSDLEAEREQLSGAVEQLRTSLGEATNITDKLMARLPLVLAAAAVAGFVYAGGVGATMRYFARRSRERR